MAINTFDGGVVLVSHDERLISLIADEIWCAYTWIRKDIHTDNLSDMRFVHVYVRAARWRLYYGSKRRLFRNTPVCVITVALQAASALCFCCRCLIHVTMSPCVRLSVVLRSVNKGVDGKPGSVTVFDGSFEARAHPERTRRRNRRCTRGLTNPRTHLRALLCAFLCVCGSFRRSSSQTRPLLTSESTLALHLLRSTRSSSRRSTSPGPGSPRAKGGGRLGMGQRERACEDCLALVGSDVRRQQGRSAGPRRVWGYCSRGGRVGRWGSRRARH